MATVDEQLLGELPRGAVEAAVRKAKAGTGTGSGVLKVIYLDDRGEPVGEWASQQAPEDPFQGQDVAGLQAPPFPLEQLVFLAESHPIHGSALDQKTADVVGKGWSWEAMEPEVSDEEQRDEIEEWLNSLAPDDSDFEELLWLFWQDWETVGWGLIEVARDPQEVARRFYHVPGHTVRAHKNGFALCQVRGQKKVWFRRWGATDVNGKKIEVDAKTGIIGPTSSPANDLFVLRKPSRRSSWYGIPGYITSVGWITLALAARDDNIMFFHNRREPRWAIVVTGLSEDSDIVEDVRRAFKVDLKQPYRNLLIPITGTDGKVTFQKLSDTAKDGSFGNLSDRADRAIMIAHRVPAERLANADVGPLGGNSVAANNRIYKDAVVGPSQELCSRRVGKLIAVEFEVANGAKPTWSFKLDDLDVSDEKEDTDIVVARFKADIYTLREARAKLGLGPLMEPLEVDPETGVPPVDEDGKPLEEQRESSLNDLLYSQLPGTSSYDDPATPSLANGDREDALAALERSVGSLLRQAQESSERFESLVYDNEESSGRLTSLERKTDEPPSR